MSQPVVELRSRWRVTLIAGAAILVVAAIVLAGDEIAHHLAALEEVVRSLGPLGLLLFVIMYLVTTSVLVPESLLAVTAGAIFGFLGGLVAVLAGALLAAVLQYWIANQLFRQPILAFAARRPLWQAMHRAVVRDEQRLQWLLRIAPLNPAMVSYLLGSVGVDFARFMLACVALVPHIVMEVYAGYAARHFIHAAHQSGEQNYLHDALVVVGLITVVAVLYQISRMARGIMEEALHDPASGPSL